MAKKTETASRTVQHLTKFTDEHQSKIDDALSAARDNRNTMAEIVLEVAHSLYGNLIYVDGEWYQGWLDLDSFGAFVYESDVEIAVQSAMIQNGVDHFFTPNGVRDVLHLIRAWLTMPNHLLF